MISVQNSKIHNTDPEYKAFGIYIINISPNLLTKDLIAGMQKFGKISSAAIYGGDNYKYYYGYVDFAEKGCAKKCMDQLMSSDEEMNFLSAGQEKSLRTFLRYKWKTTEDNPELSGIVTREYNSVPQNNNYNPSSTTIPSTTPNVMAPPYIPNSYNNHGLSNRRSGNLNLENPNLVASNNKTMNDYGRNQGNAGMTPVYYPMSNQTNGNANGLANPTTNPPIGGMMNMGMNMNMNMGMDMSMGMGMNNAVGVAGANPKMGYNNTKYAANWQNNTGRVNAGRGRGRGGLSHRASNRSIHGTRSYQANSNAAYQTTMGMETPSTPSSVSSSKGMNASAKEFVMPKKDNHRISIDNFYTYHGGHDTSSDSTSYLKEDETNTTSNSKNTNANTNTNANGTNTTTNSTNTNNEEKEKEKENNGEIIHGEEDTIVEKQSQDGSVKGDNNDVNDATETASNANESEPSTSATMTNHEINPTSEDIISSLEQNNETTTKWGDMKDSSTLPPLNIPYISNTTTTTTTATTNTTPSNTTTNTENNNNNNNNSNNKEHHFNSKSSKSNLNGNSSSDEEEGPLPEFVSKPLTRTKLNISRIPPGMTYDQLYSLFFEHGKIIDMIIKPAKIGTVAFLEYSNPSEAMEAVRELDDAYAVDEATPINQIPQNLDSLCVDYAYSDGITRHHRQGVTPIFIKGLPSNMKRGDLKIICVEFGDLAKTRLSKIDSNHGIKCSATIEYVRKDSTRLALAYLGDLFHSYGYHTVKVEKYNTNRNSYKPHP
ncbi:hypothetical protein BCR32DRAFT_274614 [Anaeromyces robustus]|uniref:RRM domain-containing protein n=1 Tax=Anaeromyces robustus TaxID=1754192 RepID=A0A1Y1XNH5_9FUNG|nr:hypothetical protein BCR32DRAFT_274614 [Anaeromyces robustus]|eukprot:ORX87307.1 hypothetical protein BCR32DRAFT_274614 [Anaeromyces robustus]